MYRPNFCAECGEKVVRLKWNAWTSGRFCDDCAKRLRVYRFKPKLIAITILLLAGFLVGHVNKSAPPPLVIERCASSHLNEATKNGVAKPDATQPNSENDQLIYMCGARTKKGTPCSRRVHGPVRCWQHKGKSSILPQDKLLIKE
jgi:hypothetical protein